MCACPKGVLLAHLSDLFNNKIRGLKQQVTNRKKKKKRTD